MSLIKDTQNELQQSLSNQSILYMKIALQKGYGYKVRDIYGQTIIGNCAIALELMIKAWIASVDLQLLYNCFPREFNYIVVTANEDKFKPYRMEILDGKYKAIELNECISLFKSHFSEQVRPISSHLKEISRIRNICIHSFLAEFNVYQVDRVIYLTLIVYKIFEEAGLFEYLKYNLTNDDTNFINTFNESRIKRVEDKLKKAKLNSKNVNLNHKEINENNEGCEVQCPICKSNAIATGEKKYHKDEGLIEFFADSFKCYGCGLQLDDLREMELAGVEDYYQF